MILETVKLHCLQSCCVKTNQISVTWDHRTFLSSPLQGEINLKSEQFSDFVYWRTEELWCKVRMNKISVVARERVVYIWCPTFHCSWIWWRKPVKKKWISLTMCCSFPGFFAPQLSPKVLLENRETLLIQLLLWCVHRGHTWQGEEEPHFSSTFDL